MGEHTTSGLAERWSGRTVRWAVACALAVAAACAGLLVSGRLGRAAVRPPPSRRRVRPAGSQDPVSHVSGVGAAFGAGVDSGRSASSPVRRRSRAGSGTSGQPDSAATTAPKAAPSPAPPAASSSAPVSASALVQFKVTSHWGEGYRAAMTITDTGAVPLTGWRLTFHVTGAQLHQPTDTGETAMTGDVVTITPADWRQPVAAGAPAVFGMEFDGVLTPPGGCALDGVPCVMQYVDAVPGQ